MSRVIKHKCFDGFAIPDDQVGFMKSNFTKAEVVEHHGKTYLLPLLSSSDVVQWATKEGYIYHPEHKAFNK